jgi:hypothetical protein
MASRLGVDQPGGVAEAVAVGGTPVVGVPFGGTAVVGAPVVGVGDLVMVGIGELVGALVDAPFGPEVGRGVYGVVGGVGVSLLVLVWAMGVGAATTGSGRTNM